MVTLLGYLLADQGHRGKVMLLVYTTSTGTVCVGKHSAAMYIIGFTMKKMKFFKTSRNTGGTEVFLD